MMVRDLLKRRRSLTHTTPSEPVKKETEALPEAPVNPYRQAVARACELARRLGLLVYEVENNGKIWIYEIGTDGETDHLIMSLDPLSFSSLAEFEWQVRDHLGKILVKRKGGIP